jgi:hypothetical protein
LAKIIGTFLARGWCAKSMRENHREKEWISSQQKEETFRVKKDVHLLGL